MRTSDLQGKTVRTESGERLGHVREIHLRDGLVTHLTCGAAGLLERFATSRRGHRIDWANVREVTDREIVVADR